MDAAFLEYITDLPPWDAAPYFDAPTSFSFTLGPTTPTNLFPADPQRFLIIVSLLTTGAPAIVGPSGLVNGTQGIQLSPQTPTQTFPYRDYANVVQLAWDGITTAGGAPIVSGLLLRLNRWPRDRTTQEQRWRKAAEPVFTPRVITTAPGRNGGRGVLDYWEALKSTLKRRQ